MHAEPYRYWCSSRARPVVRLTFAEEQILSRMQAAERGFAFLFGHGKGKQLEKDSLQGNARWHVCGSYRETVSELRHDFRIMQLRVLDAEHRC